MKIVNMKPTDVDDGALLMESINLSSEKMKNRPPNPQNKSEKGNRVKSNINQLTDETPIVLEDKLFDEVEETEQEFQNMNFLLMKNLQQKLANYLNNSNIENLFVTNLILTIISVPCLNFDPDLVECNSVLLDPELTSSYSLYSLKSVKIMTEKLHISVKYIG